MRSYSQRTICFGDRRQGEGMTVFGERGRERGRERERERERGREREREREI